MGELLLCRAESAKEPYFLEEMAINLYSVEELCYYIMQNTWLLDEDFAGKDLCLWLEKEQGQTKLAELLREGLEKKAGLKEQIGLLLQEIGYCSQKEISEVLRNLQEMEEKSEFQCAKLRADRLMESRKYLRAVYEYQRLLESREAGEQDALLLGDIWHDLGSAYARMFLFSEAVECFKKAYRLNERTHSLHCALYALLCQGREEDFRALAEEYRLGQAELEELRRTREAAIKSRGSMEMADAGKRLLQERKADRKRFQEETEGRLNDWRRDYRRICSV